MFEATKSISCARSGCDGEDGVSGAAFGMTVAASWFFGKTAFAIWTPPVFGERGAKASALWPSPPLTFPPAFSLLAVALPGTLELPEAWETLLLVPSGAELCILLF